MTLMLILAGCDSPSDNVESDMNEANQNERSHLSHDLALHVLDEILQGDADLDYYSEAYFADGEFSHLQVRLKEPKRLARKIAILNDGTITTVRYADELFASKHIEIWGVIHIDLARIMLKSPGDDF